tara:strand:- start:3010 stop:3180 length:171 start_codon:yes stop_codon:yes gene_type:complete
MAAPEFCFIAGKGQVGVQWLSSILEKRRIQPPSLRISFFAGLALSAFEARLVNQRH